MKSRSTDENSASRFSERSSSLPVLPNTTLGAHLRSLRDSLISRTANSNSSVKTKASSSSSSGGGGGVELKRRDEKRPLSGRSTPSSTSGSSTSGRGTPSLPSLPLFSANRATKGTFPQAICLLEKSCGQTIPSEQHLPTCLQDFARVEELQLRGRIAVDGCRSYKKVGWVARFFCVRRRQPLVSAAKSP